MSNKKLVMGILMVGMVATLAGAGTWASFSASAPSSGNTFTSGNLNLVLANTGDYAKGITATWVSPDKFKPGDSVMATLHAKNTGTVDAKHLYFDMSNIQVSDPKNAGTDLRKKIIITSVTENINGHPVSEEIGTILSLYDPNGDHKLSLDEFESTEWMTDDRINGVPTNNGILLPGSGNDYSITFTFQFDPTALNEYQGTGTSFDMTVKATQDSPSEGIINIHGN